MELTDEDVSEILELIDKSDFDYFEIDCRGLRLTVSKTPVSAAPAPAAPAADRSRSRNPRSTSGPGRDIPDGLIAIPAPMVGTFYPAPSPGAAPFVSPGDRVEPDTTVGLIEMMKVFTAVAAGGDRHRRGGAGRRGRGRGVRRAPVPGPPGRALSRGRNPLRRHHDPRRESQPVGVGDDDRHDAARRRAAGRCRVRGDRDPVGRPDGEGGPRPEGRPVRTHAARRRAGEATPRSG